MNKNVGNTDKTIRIIIGILLLVAAFTISLSANAKIIVIVLGVIALATGLINFCPLYKLIGVNTCKIKD